MPSGYIMAGRDANNGDDDPDQSFRSHKSTRKRETKHRLGSFRRKLGHLTPKATSEYGMDQSIGIGTDLQGQLDELRAEETGADSLLPCRQKKSLQMTCDRCMSWMSPAGGWGLAAHKLAATKC